jgi:hypothetical protein
MERWGCGWGEVAWFPIMNGDDKKRNPFVIQVQEVGSQGSECGWAENEGGKRVKRLHNVV